jgi:AbrB family looped-hinge helix DNA binding protein
MVAVRVSSKFQVVIPLEVREAINLAAGTELQVFVYGDRIELVPRRKARQLRGFLKGLDTDVKREADRL